MNSKDSNIVERTLIYAKYNLVNEKEEEKVQINNLPATLDAVRFLRHPKADPNPTYLQAAKEEIDLDIELGLKNQFEIDQKKILQRDITELTKSNEYYEVTKKLLAKIFKLRQLRSLCSFANIKEAVTETIKGAVPILTFTSILLGGLLAIIVMGHVFDKTPYWLHQGLLGIGIVLSALIALVALIGDIAVLVESNLWPLKFEYEFLSAKITLEKVEETRIVIPKMAKLKMKEAKDSGLFEGYMIAYPEFFVEEKNIKLDFGKFFRAMASDPVILGVTKDSRMFMICWWDIAKDIDRVKTHIKMFKKFKIS